MSRFLGIILAAGRGVRAYPSTRHIPKSLLKIGDKTLLEWNIELMRDQLGIQEIIIVIGYLGHKIKEHLNNRKFDVNLSFATQQEQIGIGNALLMVEKYVFNRRFVVMLGDEFYIHSNHRKLLNFFDHDYDALLTFRQEKNRAKISQNFIGNIENGRVLSLVEKPENPDTNLMGLGTYVLTGKIFRYLRTTSKSNLRGEIELTDALSNMAKKEIILPCILDGDYINITNPEDMNLANYLWRDKNFPAYTVSVVIPAYNEEQTVSHVINDFNSHDMVDEIVVVDNNSCDRTSKYASDAGARVILESRQGYGHALRLGMDEANGDILILTEADGSFRSKDIPKFLEYLKDSDMVVGTRTTRQMIEQGANMYPLLRWGNVFFGKLMQMLWWNQESRFTDVGCTFRAIWKSSYQQIRPLLCGSGPEFSPEMMIAVLVCRQRVIEIPVSYYRRIGGKSKHSKNIKGASLTALKMLRLMLKYRVRQ